MWIISRSTINSLSYTKPHLNGFCVSSEPRVSCSLGTNWVITVLDATVQQWFAFRHLRDATSRPRQDVRIEVDGFWRADMDLHARTAWPAERDKYYYAIMAETDTATNKDAAGAYWTLQCTVLSLRPCPSISTSLFHADRDENGLGLVWS